MRADGRSERQRLARWKAQTATQLGDEVEMRASIDALRSDAHGEPERIEESWVLRAQLERQLGNKARAFTCWEAAYQVRQEPTLLARAARLAERLSENARALRYWATLCEAGATSLDPCSEVERIQQINEP